ncbi:MAG: urease accessory protein UreF [Geminicoccaceae bacterium]
MTTDAALFRLLAWLSPAYPVGAYTYSHGLEWAVEAGLLRDRAGLVAWLGTVLRSGGGWQDAVLLAHAHRAVAEDDDAGWRELRATAQAWTPTAELALETRAQGEAFATASLASWPDPAGRLARLLDDGPGLTYPLAVAAVAAAHEVPLTLVLPAYLQAFAANLVSAAVRAVPLGQTDGQKALAALEPIVAEVALAARDCPLDDLGTSTLMVDLCSMRHETQYTRLFRS